MSATVIGLEFVWTSNVAVVLGRGRIAIRPEAPSGLGWRMIAHRGATETQWVRARRWGG